MFDIACCHFPNIEELQKEIFFDFSKFLLDSFTENEIQIFKIQNLLNFSSKLSKIINC